MCSGGVWEESIDVLMYELRLDCTMGELEPHPVYMRINTVTSLNGEKRAGHTGEEESRIKPDKGGENVWKWMLLEIINRLEREHCAVCFPEHCGVI